MKFLDTPDKLIIRTMDVNIMSHFWVSEKLFLVQSYSSHWRKLSCYLYRCQYIKRDFIYHKILWNLLYVLFKMTRKSSHGAKKA